MPRKPSPSKPISPGELAARLVRAHESGKRNYKRADAYMKQLSELVAPGEIITLPTGRKKVLVDKWEGKTQVSTGAYCRRFELEDVPV